MLDKYLPSVLEYYNLCKRRDPTVRIAPAVLIYRRTGMSRTTMMIVGACILIVIVVLALRFTIWAD